MDLLLPARLSASCRKSSEASDWLSRLPVIIRQLQARWAVTLGRPYDNDELSCAWVAPVTCAGDPSAGHAEPCTAALLRRPLASILAENLVDITDLDYAKGRDGRERLGIPAVQLVRPLPLAHDLAHAPAAQVDIPRAGRIFARSLRGVG